MARSRSPQPPSRGCYDQFSKANKTKTTVYSRKCKTQNGVKTTFGPGGPSFKSVQSLRHPLYSHCVRKATRMLNMLNACNYEFPHGGEFDRGREGGGGKGHRRINDDGGKSRHISLKCTLECF